MIKGHDLLENNDSSGLLRLKSILENFKNNGLDPVNRKAAFSETYELEVKKQEQVSSTTAQ